MSRITGEQPRLFGSIVAFGTCAFHCADGREGESSPGRLRPAQVLARHLPLRRGGRPRVSARAARPAPPRDRRASTSPISRRSTSAVLAEIVEESYRNLTSGTDMQYVRGTLMLTGARRSSSWLVRPVRYLDASLRRCLGDIGNARGLSSRPTCDPRVAACLAKHPRTHRVERRTRGCSAHRGCGGRGHSATSIPALPDGYLDACRGCSTVGDSMRAARARPPRASARRPDRLFETKRQAASSWSSTRAARGSPGRPPRQSRSDRPCAVIARSVSAVSELIRASRANSQKNNVPVTRQRYLSVIHSFQRPPFAVAGDAECDCRTLLVQGRGSAARLCGRPSIR